MFSLHMNLQVHLFRNICMRVSLSLVVCIERVSCHTEWRWLATLRSPSIWSCMARYQGCMVSRMLIELHVCKYNCSGIKCVASRCVSVCVADTSVHFVLTPLLDTNGTRIFSWVSVVNGVLKSEARDLPQPSLQCQLSYWEPSKHRGKDSRVDQTISLYIYLYTGYQPKVFL